MRAALDNHLTGGEVVSHVRDAGLGAGGVVVAGGHPGQALALGESEVAAGPHSHPLLPLPEQPRPVGVAEHLPRITVFSLKGPNMQSLKTNKSVN